MTKLRSIAVVAVLGAALFASRAQAEDGGWNTKYGMIFGVQNVFDNGSASILSGYNGQVGLQYTLAPQTALRLSVDLNRSSVPVLEGTDTNAAGVKTDWLQHPNQAFFGDPTNPAYTSYYRVGLGAAYMMRLTTSAIAPYMGVGGNLAYDRTALKFTDDVNHSYNEKVDDSMYDITLSGVGLLGVEWRVHPSIAIFAEYKLNVDLVSFGSASLSETDTDKATGLSATVSSEGSGKTFLNWSTGLGQQGLLGLVAFF